MSFEATYSTQDHLDPGVYQLKVQDVSIYEGVSKKDGKPYKSYVFKFDIVGPSSAIGKRCPWFFTPLELKAGQKLDKTMRAILKRAFNAGETVNVKEAIGREVDCLMTAEDDTKRPGAKQNKIVELYPSKNVTAAATAPVTPVATTQAPTSGAPKPAATKANGFDW